MTTLPESGAGRKWCVVSLPHWVYRTHGRAYRTEKEWWTGGGNIHWSTRTAWVFDTREEAEELVQRLVATRERKRSDLKIEAAPKW